MMDPTTLLPAAKASGRCPPLLIRDDAIVEGGVFEMALLRSLNMVHGESSKNQTINYGFRTETGGMGIVVRWHIRSIVFCKRLVYIVPPFFLRS